MKNKKLIYFNIKLKWKNYKCFFSLKNIYI